MLYRDVRKTGGPPNSLSFVFELQDEAGAWHEFPFGPFPSARASHNLADVSLSALQRMAERGGFTIEEFYRTVDECKMCINGAGDYVPPP